MLKWVAMVLVSAWILLGLCGQFRTPWLSAMAQDKTAIPKAQDKLALGEQDVKQLLLLMDTNRNGKISKQEWMTYMGAEFDRLDKDHSGELDPKELQSSSLRVSHPASVGK